jgi:hypothetical protein
MENKILPRERLEFQKSQGRQRKRARLLDLSAPLSFDKEIPGEAIDDFINVLYGKISSLETEAMRRRAGDDKKRHLKLLVLHLLYSFVRKPFLYTGVSLRPADYTSKLNRYRSVPTSWRNFDWALKGLLGLNLIKLWPGWHDSNTGIGFRTRIRARRKLVDIARSYSVEPEKIFKIGREEVIVLRDALHKEIDYKDDENTRQMRANLTRINAEIAKRRIRLFISDASFLALSQSLARHRDAKRRGPIDLSRVLLRRVFNNSTFQDGGRFYGGWWQNIPAESRKFIQIDHKATIELDYSGLHIRMLYLEEGLEPPDDPYDSSNNTNVSFPRDDQKAAIIQIINGESRRSVEQSLRATLSQKQSYVRALTDSIMRRHQPISHHFFSGKGVSLQFEDSQLAEDVMLEIIELGGIALPVHDSFIVRIGREDELLDAMRKAFVKHFPGAKPLAKSKPTTSEEPIETDEQFTRWLEELATTYKYWHN